MTTQPVAPLDVDILQHVAVRVPCTACGQYYDVTLREVLLSHAVLHAGCSPTSRDECPPLVHAALADETALRDLERSWRRVIQQVTAMGLNLTVCRTSLSH